MSPFPACFLWPVQVKHLTLSSQGLAMSERSCVFRKSDIYPHDIDGSLSTDDNLLPFQILKAFRRSLGDGGHEAPPADMLQLFFCVGSCEIPVDDEALANGLQSFLRTSDTLPGNRLEFVVRRRPVKKWLCPRNLKWCFPSGSGGTLLSNPYVAL